MLLAVAAVLLATDCTESTSSAGGKGAANDDLVGAWRGRVRFKTGDFATLKDLEFMYVFNAGGTMTESSNFDAAPPVPPAYGVWRKTGPRQFLARYEFYWTKPPKTFDDVAKGGGWSPGGRGVFLERIALSENGNSFTSTMKYDAFDQAGKPTETGSQAETQVARMGSDNR